MIPTYIVPRLLQLCEGFFLRISQECCILADFPWSFFLRDLVGFLPKKFLPESLARFFFPESTLPFLQRNFPWVYRGILKDFMPDIIQMLSQDFFGSSPGISLIVFSQRFSRISPSIEVIAGVSTEALPKIFAGFLRGFLSSVLSEFIPVMLPESHMGFFLEFFL